MKHDSRPISEQVTSGLKVGAIIVALLLLSFPTVSVIPLHRIEAYIWHLRYGNAVTVGNFRFPAPKNWYVQAIQQNNRTFVNLDNGDAILLWSDAHSKKVTLAAWSEAQEYSRNPNTQITAKREMKVADETLLCLERDDDLQKLHLHSVNCRFESGLEILFTPHLGLSREGYGRFYSLLMQIHRL